jgi:hypothetical protein
MEQGMDMTNRVKRAALGAVRILFGLKVGLKDRFQDQHDCRHHHPVRHGRNAQRSSSSRLASLGDMDPSHRRWTIPFRFEPVRQFTEPWLNPSGLDILESLMVHPFGTAIAATLLVRGP